VVHTEALGAKIGGDDWVRISSDVSTPGADLLFPAAYPVLVDDASNSALGLVHLSFVSRASLSGLLPRIPADIDDNGPTGGLIMIPRRSYCYNIEHR
jgi:hypothetical protein